MVISSLVVGTAPGSAHSVKASLEALPGVEVHSIQAGGKIVVTIERDTVDESQDVANEMILLDGVLGVDLIYLNFEDDKTIYPDGV